jgi:hypothetical protein
MLKKVPQNAEKCSAAEKLEDPIREYHRVKESRNDDTKTPQVYGAVQV